MLIEWLCYRCHILNCFTHTIRKKLIIRQTLQPFIFFALLEFNSKSISNCNKNTACKLSECFTKLYRPPITTHSHFDLNETVSYPAITFCRDPPYKEDVLRVSFIVNHLFSSEKKPTKMKSILVLQFVVSPKIFECLAKF